jgi:hypothetical protein
MQRRAAALPEDGVDHLGQGARRDEACDRFVLEERLASYLRLQSSGKEGDGTAGRGRAERRDADRCEPSLDWRTI